MIALTTAVARVATGVLSFWAASTMAWAVASSAPAFGLAVFC
jgi:hypothetical protein